MTISQVFCHVAARLNAEGAEKTWDQCRIKLKNLKSQYRYIKVCKLYFIKQGLQFNRKICNRG